jgi:hypothetical protein
MTMKHVAAGPEATDGRVALGFRAGVTGHRELDKGDIGPIEAAAGRVLDDVTQALRHIAAYPAAQKLYRKSAPVLRLVSPLAEGADRLLALAAVPRGWRLVAPLPFTQTEYERDFPLSVDEFRTLVAHAEATGEVVELDGTRAAADVAYLQVGRFVLRHSDLLIAVWNGEAAAGIGGTGQIVEEAQALGVPVVHIAAAPPHSIRLLTAEAEPKPHERSELAAILSRVVLPEWPKGDRDHPSAAEEYLVRERVRLTGVAPDFLYQGPFAAPETWLGHVFPSLIRWLAGRPSQTTTVMPGLPPAGPEYPAVRAGYLHFQRADALATHYAEVHRSAFVLIYILGSGSLVAAITALFLRITEPPWAGLCATTFELFFILLMLALYLTERSRRLRERWFDYRLLSEMLRQIDLLAQIGGVPLTGCLDRVGDMHPERGWVPWLVGAIVRSIGVVGTRYDRAYLERVQNYAVQTRLADQIAYHERASRRNASVGLRLRRMSEALFALTIVASSVELLVWPEGWPPGPAWLAGVLPAIAAASFGIRNQAEFEIVVHRSARLRERLSWERDKISRLAGERLTSAALIAAMRRARELCRLTRQNGQPSSR